MDPLAIYAITAGGIFAILFLVRALSLFASCGHLFSLVVSQHLTLPFVIRRHRFLGPWTRAGVLLHLSYAAINVFLVSFRITSLTGAGRRAGELALVNLVFPLSTIHLAYLADLLGIKWQPAAKPHKATKWLMDLVNMASIPPENSYFVVQDAQDMRDRLPQTGNLQILSFMDVVQGVCVKPGTHFFLEPVTPTIARGGKYPTPVREARGQIVALGGHRDKELFGELRSITPAAMKQDGCVRVRTLR
ncbi:hypothetical protein ABOM_012088 [Aspergillus bombycis]|uniref:Uncharacterized protein n=1 Tax=Aspergillus bombycis TaxID=109264 RepID=A0A1F7ZJ93_9EURO|nr:hypothetical protein ABOM_012088 [Aspergillus bombycis]OGM39527.1 hypothetical protein ABOM_012088 [Aspergillus bombycis]